MQKNQKPFTDNEISILRGNFSAMARKYDCDKSTVSKICNGDRQTNTVKAKEILNSLNEKLTEIKEALLK